MYHSCFTGWEVKEEFTKEHVSLWGGWLGEDSYKLCLVTESEWSRFNDFIILVSQNFELKLVVCNTENTLAISNIQNTLATYAELMDKDSWPGDQEVFKINEARRKICHCNIS